MKIVSLQPAVRPDGVLPYPIHVDLATGQVQQQSFWRGNLVQVLGFQADENVQRIDVWLEEFQADPQSVVGHVLVGRGDKGGIAQYGTPIRDVVVREFEQAIA